MNVVPMSSVSFYIITVEGKSVVYSEVLSISVVVFSEARNCTILATTVHLNKIIFFHSV